MGCVPYQTNASFNSSPLPFSSGFGMNARPYAQRQRWAGSVWDTPAFLGGLLGESEKPCEESCFLVCV